MFRHTRDSRLLFQQNLFIRLCWVQQTDFTAFIRLLSAAKFKNHDPDPSFQPGLTRFILVENTADTVESRATYLFVACKFQAQQQAFFIAVCDKGAHIFCNDPSSAAEHASGFTSCVCWHS